MSKIFTAGNGLGWNLAIGWNEIFAALEPCVFKKNWIPALKLYRGVFMKPYALVMIALFSFAANAYELNPGDPMFWIPAQSQITATSEFVIPANETSLTLFEGQIRAVQEIDTNAAFCQVQFIQSSSARVLSRESALAVSGVIKGKDFFNRPYVKLSLSGKVNLEFVCYGDVSTKKYPTYGDFQDSLGDLFTVNLAAPQ